MLCPHCKKENPHNTRWCCYCGALLELPPSESARLEAPDGSEWELDPQTPPAQELKPQKKYSEQRSPSPQKKRSSRRTRRHSILPWIVLSFFALALILAACVLFLPSLSRLPIPAPRDEAGGKPQDPPQTYQTAQPAQSGPSAAEQPLSGLWSEVYESFVLDQMLSDEDSASTAPGEKTFTVNGLSFYKSPYSQPGFSLYDMDGSGIPELVVFNGAPSLAAATDYVFTCENGQLQYLGNIGFRGCQLYCFDGSSYQGLFCSDGNNGVVRTVYYELKNGSIVSEDLDASLVNAIGVRSDLPFRTLEEIRGMGWESFVREVSSRPRAEKQDPLPEPEVPRRTVITLDAEKQYAANIFLSNFSEQGAFEKNGFDVNACDYGELLNFACLYCRINRPDKLSVDGNFYTLSLDAVNEVLNRHFALTVSDAQAAQILPDPSGTNTFSHYSGGTFYFYGADGESYNRLTVVKRMESLGDGTTCHVWFDIYALDTDVYYGYNGGAVNPQYYYSTEHSAKLDPNLILQTSGEADVRPYEHDGIQTMQLIRYTVN